MLAKQLQGAALASQPVFIEDTFSTYLYTGNGSTQTITNGIDLAGKGGLVWCKQRDGSALHLLYDTNRGAGYRISSDLTDAQVYDATTRLTSFTSSGFTLGNLSPNTNGATYVSWTFREQPKFFDVVTYTGDGVARTIPHNLGSVPGCFIVKKINGDGRWSVYHRSLGNTKYLQLNATNAEDTVTTFWNSTDPTSTVFSIGTNSIVNASGDDYIVYLFAHNAEGFGLTGTDNVISCGSFTYDSTNGNNINLGYEAQFVILKDATNVTQWYMQDVMRGMTAGPTSGARLFPNLSSAEDAGFIVGPNATGFNVKPSFFSSGANVIYIAIRRGPMKTPTTGTSVFEPVTDANNDVFGTLQAFDMGFFKDRNTSANNFISDRLRGFTTYYNPTLYTNLTNAEATPTTGDTVYSITSAANKPNGQGYFGGAGSYQGPLGYSFRRAPGFFDVVCYTGTGSSPGTQNHNLGVIPEFILTKKRNAAQDWSPIFQNGSVTNWAQFFALTSAAGVSAGDLSSYVSSSTFSGNIFSSNNSASTYVAYLFATLAGVSKVGSYNGSTGNVVTVPCGFTAGARFVLIKRFDSTGDWYVWDSARGISSGNDPYLLLNDAAAEVTGTNYVDTTAVGFQVTAAAPAALNASGGTYIFLAIA